MCGFVISGLTGLVPLSILWFSILRYLFLARGIRDEINRLLGALFSHQIGEFLPATKFDAP